METKNRVARTIVWAIDPFCNPSTILRSAARALRGLSKGTPTQVHPVYVWRTALFDLPVEPAPEFLKDMQKRGENELDSVLTRIKVPGIQPLKVISRPAVGIRDAGRALVDYAKEISAEMILVSSHGHKGMKRFFLGSFAETLTLYSDVPLFIVHPFWRRAPTFKEILFPTDFSDESKEAFVRVLDFAAAQKSRITIFHKAGLPIYPGWTASDFAFSAYPQYQRAFEAELIANELEAKKMADLAKSRGLRATVVMDKSAAGSVAEGILRRSEKADALIAMVSQSGPVTSVLLGSTTRGVVRHSRNPIWVIHPSRKEQKKRETVEPLFRVTSKDIEGDLIRHKPQQKKAS